MKDTNNITLNLDKPDSLAIDIVKTYLNNQPHNSINYGINDYTKLFIINYTMVCETLNKIKNSKITFEQLSKDFCDKYDSTETN